MRCECDSESFIFEESLSCVCADQSEKIGTLEAALGRTAIKHMRPMQPGDVTATFADVSKLHALTGYRPKVMLGEGIGRFVQWYREFYGA